MAVSRQEAEGAKFRWTAELGADDADRKATGTSNRERVFEAVKSGAETKGAVVRKTGLAPSTVGSHLGALANSERITRSGTNKTTRYAIATDRRLASRRERFPVIPRIQ